MNFKLISRKNNLFWNKVQRKKSGIVLIIVLWVLVILSALAISLGRKTNIELALTKNMIGKTRTKFVSWAGVVYAINHISKDTKDKVSAAIDTFAYCGVKDIPGVSLESLFSERQVGEGFFDIAYSQTSSEERLVKEKKRFYGLSDEERKININALTEKNYKILSQLIVYLGYDEEVSDIISAATVDWADGNDSITGGAKGAENEYYEALKEPYRCKNAYFDAKEELLLVRGMTKEIYHDLKEYVTVFPKGGKFQVNFDTATEPVLYALARAEGELSPTADEADADSLVRKILVQLRGDDGMGHTEDDVVVEFKDLALNAIERNIFLAMNRYRTKGSEFLNIQVVGVDKNRGARSYVEAIVSRDEYSIVYWNRR